MWKKGKVKAFTLLEALVALLVISGGLLLFQSMGKLLAQEMSYQTQQEQRDWILFADQLEVELSRSQFIKVENNRVFLKQDGKEIALGKSSKDDFRKTNASNQGYQPMIYGVKEARIHQDGRLLKMTFSFEKGLEREFVYAVAEKS